ncbi:MAG: type and secretion system protein [Verrucomicrobiales bacterium]|nr:type and secretion system protein [Verrucomicrobiales bacterium]
MVFIFANEGKNQRKTRMKTIIGTAALMAISLSLAQSEPSKLKGYLVAAAEQEQISRSSANERHQTEEKGASMLKSRSSQEKRETFQRPSGIRKRPAGAVFSSLDEPKSSEPKDVDANAILFNEADVEEVLDLYQDLSGRSILRSANLPQLKITFRNELPLSRREALQTLDTVLSGNGIAMIIFGKQNVKAVPAKEAAQEAGPIVDWLPERLPDSGTYIVYVVHTKADQFPREIAAALQPLAKMPNSILAIDQAHMLVLRDYSCNIRQMLQIMDRLGPMQPMQPPPRRGNL